MKTLKSKIIYILVIACFLLGALLLTKFEIKPESFGKALARVGICIGHTPVLDTITNLTGLTNQEFYYQANSSSEGESVIYADNTTHFEINETTGIINFTPTTAISELVRISVNNSYCNDLWDFEDVNLTVETSSLPPVLETIEDFNTTEDVEFYYDVNATDPDNDTLTFSDNTTLFEIDSASGIITFTPINDNVGVHWVTIKVTDPWGLSDEQSVNVNVTNVNDAPTIQTIPNFTVESGTPVYEDDDFYYRVVASDIDGDVLDYQDNTPLFVINSETGEIYFLPRDDQVGNYSITVYVVDGQALASQLFLMEILEVNDNPILTPIGAQTAYINQTYYYDVNASDEEDGSDTDPDNTNLTFWSDSTLFNITPKNGTIEFTPTDSDLGTYSIIISVNDSTGMNTSETVSFSVVIQNRPPNITSYWPLESTLSMYTGESQGFNITKEDPDGTTPSVYWYVDSSLITQDTDTYTFSPSASGIVNITVIVSDGEYDVAHEWTVTVSEAPITAPGPPGAGGGGGGGGMCDELWVCTDWSGCFMSNVQTRECRDENNCRTAIFKPRTKKSCIYREIETCYDKILNQNEILVDCGGVCSPCPTCTDWICNQGESCQVCGGEGCLRDENGNLVPDCGGPCQPCVFPKIEMPEEAPIDYGKLLRGSLWWLLIIILIIILLLKLRQLIRKMTENVSKEMEEADNRKVEQIKKVLKLAYKSLEKNELPELKRQCSYITTLYNKIESMKKKREIYPKISFLINKMKSRLR